jgi:DNA polymerase III alpha subunit
MDVDIDVADAAAVRALFNWTRASLVRSDSGNSVLAAHNCGVHPQTIPIDPLTKLSAIPYEAAEELGYFKIDFLPLNVYQHFSSRKEIEELIAKEPDWTLLLVQSNHSKLFQLSNHGDLILKLRPSSLLELADINALIRPGKRALLPLYIKDREVARKVLWKKDESGYTFKKAHALGYAHVLLLQLHLIEMGRL